MQINNNKYKFPYQLKQVLFFFGLAFFIISGVSAKYKTPELWLKANHYYEQKQFDSAISNYLLLEKEGMISAALYYNIGNAYYRLNNTGLSVLYYQKALHKAPNNQNILDNLELAKQQIQHPLTTLKPIFFIQWWNSFVTFLPVAFWAVFTFLLFVILLSFLYFQKVRNVVSYSGRWLSLIIIVLLGSCLVFYATGYKKNNSNLAVVMSEEASLFHETNKAGTSIEIPEGTTILINGEKDNYYAAELPNGANGWIPKDEVRKVIENKN